MVDIRQRVVEDRGLLSKIQAFIPGFSGYRAKEDLRAADNMLRMQIAEKLAAVRKDIEGCRSAMSRNNALDSLEPLGALIARFKTAETAIGHAAQGYSGISAKIQVGEPQLNKLYEYDFALLSSLADMGAEAQKLKASASANDGAGIRAGIDALRSKVDALESTFKMRMHVITDTGV